MAKGKKQELSLEELLEQAIVKEDKQPYEVPSNWAWTKLGYIAKWGSGGTPSRKNPNFYGGDIPWIKTGELNNGYIYDAEEKITEEAIQKSSAKLFPINTVAIAMYGATIGKVGVFGLEAATNQACACAVSNTAMQYKYLFYYLQSQKQAFIDKGKGGAQPNISQEVIKEHPCPLPPLAEQQRIVERIESLFEKLDTAKELAQNALDSFENRKTAILHKAFIGELTAKWREENNVSLDSWEEQKIKDICRFRAGYAFDSKKFTEKGYQVIRMGNLYNGIIDLNRNPVYYPVDEIEESVLQKSKINKGDILLTLTGTKYKRDYGYAVLIDTDDVLLLNQRIVAITPTTVEVKFLLNYLKTNIFRDIFFSNETGGVNQGNVSSRFVENILVPIPTLEEQKEIVRLLEKLLNNEQQAQELCNVIEKIDLMKKAILARAFRGELGTKNLEEESAIELLKEVLKEKL